MIIGEAVPVRGADASGATWRGRRPPERQIAGAMPRWDLPEAAGLAGLFLEVQLMDHDRQPKRFAEPTGLVRS